MNLVRAHIGDTIDFGRFQIPLHRDRRPSFTGPVILGIRPEAFESAEFAASGLPQIDVDVEVLEDLGSDAHVFFSINADQVVIEDALTDDPEDETSILAEEKNRTLLVARVDARTNAAVGGRVRLALDPSRLYFFSPESGESLLNGSSPHS